MLLRQRYPDVTIEVQNAGNAWYTTAHLLIDYQLLVRQFEPDLIVVFEAINDLYRSFSPPWWALGEFRPDYSHYLGPYSRFLGPDVGLRASASPLVLSDLLVWRRLREDLLGEPSPYRFDAANLGKAALPLAPTNGDDLPEPRQLSQLLRAIDPEHPGRPPARHHGFSAVIYSDALPADVRDSLFFAHVFCAENGFYPTMESMMSGMQDVQRLGPGPGRGEGCPFLDFEGAVPKTRAYFSDDVHLTAAGNEILARMVFDRIVGRSLIGARSPSMPRATSHFSRTRQVSSPAR